MGKSIPGFDAAEDATAEALLSSLESISPSERRRHATVFNYWLSIRGENPMPSVRDLDPLEMSDAGPCSVLLELTGGGVDAEIRHLGNALETDAQVERISEAPRPSLLSCIADKLGDVASLRHAMAFEDEFTTDRGTTRCSVTLLPFSSTGADVDYVYGFVSWGSDAASAEAAEPAETDDLIMPLAPVDEGEEMEEIPMTLSEEQAEPVAEVQLEPVEPVGSLQERLAEARAKADAARLAKLQVEVALVEALSEAYDFAVDAEGSANEYLKLVEQKGLTIQLRSPMAPVVKLAFDGLTDDATIGELETVMAWALRMNLPRGSLGARVQEAGGLEAALAEAIQAR